MKKVVAAVAGTVAAGLLIAGAAAPASAETLYRTGANKVTITPQGAPEGAVITKAKVTVKKGKKTVARNKNFYKAKKGKYKVTSTISYFPVATVQMQPGNVYAECRVTNRELVSDRTEWKYAGDPDAWLYGQVTIRYTGDCTEDPVAFDYAIGSWVPSVTWQTTWIEDPLVMVDYTGTTDRNATILADSDVAKIGDVANVSGDKMSSVPTYTTHGDQTTGKTVRTVVVR